MQQPLIVGISGGSGSGKTRFAANLKASFDEGQVEIFTLDNYYLPIEQQPVDELGEANFDMPQSFDRKKLQEDLLQLKAGKDLLIPQYDFNINRGGQPKMITVKACPIIIVEGLFTFYFEELSPAIDLKLFVEAPIWLMMKRRIERDEFERGYGDLKATLDRYERHVIPAFNEFVLPTREDADIIIPNHSNFEKGLSVVTNHLKSLL